MSLVALEESRTFPPKMYLLVVWIVTSLFALFGIIVSAAWSIAFWIWTAVLLVSLRQVWATHWIQVDQKGIRVRNLLFHRKEVEWDTITDVNEREIPVRKNKSFFVLKISGEMNVRSSKETTIMIDSDIAGFDILRELIQNVMVSKASEQS
ncbi:MAG: hypothetical protein J4G05_01320 [Chlorobi bacterium]|nr:hypothetical protein [Chlorobiota bacterium]